MVIDFKPEQQQIIDRAIESGAYRKSREVLDQALELIREQLDVESWTLENRNELAAHIERGFAESERGELIDGDNLIETLRRRRAERMKPH